MNRLSVLMLAALILQGCSVGKKDPKRDHKAQAATVQDQSATPADSKAGYYGLDLNKLHKLATEGQVAQRSENIVSPLAAIILDPSNLASPQFKAHRQTPWALSFFNAQLIAGLKENPKDANLLKIVETYRQRILEGCNMQTLTGCRNMEILALDPGLGTLIKVMALNTKDVEAYYRLLGLAHEIQGRAEDAELSNMVISRMAEFFKLYLDIKETGALVTMAVKPLSQDRKEEFGFYSRFIATVIRLNPKSQIAGDRALELYRWVASGQMADVLGLDLTVQISDLVSNLLETPEMWTQFMTIFAQNEANKESSYSNALKRIKRVDPKLLERLGIVPYDLDRKVSERSKDLAAMLFLSRLYDLRQPSREMYLWNLAKLEPLEAMKLIEAFVRVTMVDRALSTHKMMAQHYKRYEFDSGSGSDLFDETMKVAEQQVAPQWKDYISRLSRIEDFFKATYEDRFASNDETPVSKETKRIRTMFDELNPSIKYFVTYPNMLMFGYYAAKHKLNMAFRDMAGTIYLINDQLILFDLMEGKTPPLFVFTSFKAAESKRNFDGIDSVQMMWALNFTMVMDLPGIYGIPGDEFMDRFITTYKSKTDKNLVDLINKQEELTKSSGDLRRLYDYCSVEEGGPRIVDYTLELRNLSKLTFMGQLSEESISYLRPAVQAAANSNTKSLQSAFDEALETLRSDVDPKMRRLFLMRSAFQQARSTDAATLAKIDQKMRDTLGYRNRLLSMTRDLIQKLPPCMLKMRNVEERRTREVVKMEIAFTKYVQDALNAFEGVSSEAVGLAKLKASNAFFASLDTTKPADQALNDHFIRATGLDYAFSRIVDSEGEYRTNGGFQRKDDGSLTFIYRRNDLILRMAMYLDRGFDGQTISFPNFRPNISWPQDTRVFTKNLGGSPSNLSVQAGVGSTVSERLLKTFGTYTTLLQRPTATVVAFRHFLRLASALFKFDYLGNLDLSAVANCDQACKDQRKEEARQRSLALLDYSRSMLDAFNLNQEDFYILNSFKTFTYFNFTNESYNSKRTPESLFADSNYAQDLIGMGDEVFTYLTSIRLGHQPLFRELRPTAEKTWFTPENDNGGADGVATSDELMTRSDPYYMASKYYLSFVDKAKLLQFKIDPSIDRQIELFHTHQIRSDMEMAEIFTNAASEWESKNTIPLVQFATKMAPQRMKVLSTSLVGNYREQMRRFNESTQFTFATPELQTQNGGAAQ